MRCRHGTEYPREGSDPEVGPWTCNADGSNPACPNCEPDAWKSEELVSVPIELFMALLGYVEEYEESEANWGNESALRSERIRNANELLREKRGEAS